MFEIAVREEKTHFVTIICEAHPSFKLGKWDLLVPYVRKKLNLLRPLKVQTLQSRHTMVFIDRLMNSPFMCWFHSI